MPILGRINTNNELDGKKDEELVSLTLKNKDFYAYLMQRYEDKLKRYVIRLAGLQTEDAEDVLQEVFVKAYQNLNSFDINLKFSSWIYRIAHNQAVSFLRKKSTLPKTIGSQNLNTDSVNYLDILISDFNLEKNIDRSFLKENVLKSINNLKDPYKQVIILRYMEDKDYNEMSDILRKPVGTVATLLRRAKALLKKEILKKELVFKPYV